MKIVENDMETSQFKYNGGSPRKPQSAPFANQSSERLTEFEVNFYCREYIKKLK